MIYPMDLTGRLFLITGASSGIGRETSILLSRLGARVILVARDQGRLESTLPLLEGTGHHYRSFDLTQCDQIPAFIKTVATEIAPLNGLVHSAGVISLMPVRGVDTKYFDKLMHLQVLAGAMLLRGLRQKGCHTGPTIAPSIVYVGSSAGLVGVRGMSIYSAAKGALMSLVRSQALELASEGIRVNSITAGAILTESVEAYQASAGEVNAQGLEKYHPLGLGKPSDLAHAIAFLLADTGRWCTGSNLVIDGGLTSW